MHHGGHRRQRARFPQRLWWGLPRPLGQAVQLQVRQLELKQLEPEPEGRRNVCPGNMEGKKMDKVWTNE